MTRHLVSYLGALLVIGVLDALWLGVVAKDWYREAIGHLMAPSFNVPAAAAFYFLFPVGLIVFAVAPAQGDLVKAAWTGALFGLFCYGTYDLTSLAVLRDWPLSISLIDMAWGCAIGAAGATAGTAAGRMVTA